MLEDILVLYNLIKCRQDALVNGGNEVVLVLLECGVDHFDGGRRRERRVYWGCARISGHKKWYGLQECVHDWGHRKARPTMEGALWALKEF